MFKLAVVTVLFGFLAIAFGNGMPGMPGGMSQMPHMPSLDENPSDSMPPMPSSLVRVARDLMNPMVAGTDGAAIAGTMGQEMMMAGAKMMGAAGTVPFHTLGGGPPMGGPGGPMGGPMSG
ncbi:uncharacterized protein LOC106653155 [Trichogramma pretiosum]|uniref:uncharacterized protein LOC106653155 n=1 Tax=Trichogramma pretiosum TaxID=7493 RepID=UPI0006C9B238|nr:uncharacterized protein LOC106653155 [Trichogramma pretiosum]